MSATRFTLTIDLTQVSDGSSGGEPGAVYRALLRTAETIACSTAYLPGFKPGQHEDVRDDDGRVIGRCAATDGDVDTVDLW